MKFLTLEEIKKHTRIDGDIEDSLLEMYGESAEDTIINICNQSLECIIIKYGKVPTPIRHAALLLTAHSYNNREAASPTALHAVPYSIDILLKPYMIL